MKKLSTIILAVVLLSVTALPSFAQGRDRRVRTNQTRVSRTYNQRSYYDYGYRDRSFWEQHRDKVTVGAGAGAGALLGAVIGGKKGAIIGALAGGGVQVHGHPGSERRRDARQRHRHNKSELCEEHGFHHSLSKSGSLGRDEAGCRMVGRELHRGMNRGTL